MKYDSKNIKYTWAGTHLEPANKKTKLFDNALPENFCIKIDSIDVDKSSINISLLNDDESPSFSAYSYLRDNVRDTLTNKTNIPEELVRDAYIGTYKRDEELAFLLRFYIEDIRRNEKTGKGPNVTKSITRSEIGYIASEILEARIGEDQPQIILLLRALLNLDKAQQKIEATTSYNARKNKAFKLKVALPELSIQKISEIIEVDRSTVSKWFSADDAKNLMHQTRHNPTRIYIYWTKNKNLNLKEIALNLGIDIDYLNELKNNKHHKTRWKLHLHGNNQNDLGIF